MMEKLSIFEKKVLEVLLKLQYNFDVISSAKPDTKKGIIYTIGDMIPPVKGEEEIEYVVGFLKARDLDISITHDFNIDPRNLIEDGEYVDINSVPLGLIRGKNIDSIKNRIKKIIDELENEELKKERLYQKGEHIELKTLNILIKDGRLIYKKMKSQDLNPSDQSIINFLYSEFINDQIRCFKKEELEIELGIKSRYVVNRISLINKEIRKMITTSKTSIDDFIKNEKRRGYHLNSRFMIQFTKKKNI